MNRTTVCLLSCSLLGLLSCLALACGGSGISGHQDAGNQNVAQDAAPDAAQDAAQDAAPPLPDAAADADVPEGCDAVQAGTNSGFMVDGLARSFILTLPSDIGTGGPFPVVFNWHGLGDTAANIENQLLSSHVNTAGFHFILVTPEDSNFNLYGQVVDWEVFQVDPATTGRCGCLMRSWPA